MSETRVEEEPVTLKELDIPIIEHILSFLPPEYLPSFRLVSKDLREIIDRKLKKVFYFEEVSIHTCTKSAYMWKKWPAVTKLYYYRPTTNNYDNNVDALAVALVGPQSWDIQALEISHGALTTVGTEAVAWAATHNWPNLRTLQLRVNNLEAGAFLKLADGDFGSLQELDLTGNEIGNLKTAQALAKVLARCPRLQILNLTSSSLSGSTLGELLDVRLAHLEQFIAEKSLNFNLSAPNDAISKAWPSLKVFNINGGWVYLESMCDVELPTVEKLMIKKRCTGVVERYDEGEMYALAEAMTERWRNVKELEIGLVEKDAGAAFFNSYNGGPYPKLERLDDKFLHNRDVRTLNKLAEANLRGKLPSLKHLHLWFRDRNAALALQGVFATCWPNLEELCIYTGDTYPEYGITSSLAKALGSAVEDQRLPAVKKLDLQIAMRPHQLQYIFKAPWPSVEELRLHFGDFKDEHVAALSALFPTKLPNLQKLRFGEPRKMTRAGYHRLFQTAWPESMYMICPISRRETSFFNFLSFSDDLVDIAPEWVPEENDITCFRQRQN